MEFFNKIVTGLKTLGLPFVNFFSAILYMLGLMILDILKCIGYVVFIVLKTITGLMGTIVFFFTFFFARNMSIGILSFWHDEIYERLQIVFKPFKKKKK